MKGIDYGKIFSVIYRVFVLVNFNNPILLNAFLYTFKLSVRDRATYSKYL